MAGVKIFMFAVTIVSTIAVFVEKDKDRRIEYRKMFLEATTLYMVAALIESVQSYLL